METKPLEEEVEAPADTESDADLDSLFKGDDDDSSVEELSLAEINEKAGREFKSKDEFLKHYENLKKFAGKVNQPNVKPQAPQTGLDVAGELMALKSQIAEKDFLSENPTAKEHLDLVKAFAKESGKTLNEAWETKVKELVEGSNAYKNDLEVGVRSTNRLNPMESKNQEELKQAARSGDYTAQLNLVAGFNKALGDKK